HAAVGTVEDELVVGVALCVEAGVEQSVVTSAAQAAITHVGGAAFGPPAQVVDVDDAALTAREAAPAPVAHGDGPALGPVPHLGLAPQVQGLASQPDVGHHAAGAQDALQLLTEGGAAHEAAVR